MREVPRIPLRFPPFLPLRGGQVTRVIPVIFSAVLREGEMGFMRFPESKSRHVSSESGNLSVFREGFSHSDVSPSSVKKKSVVLQLKRSESMSGSRALFLYRLLGAEGAETDDEEGGRTFVDAVHEEVLKALEEGHGLQSS